MITRRLGQRVRIGEDIWVTIVDIEGRKIRLGIDAPKEIIISREELIPPAPPRESCPPDLP